MLLPSQDRLNFLAPNTKMAVRRLVGIQRTPAMLQALDLFIQQMRGRHYKKRLGVLVKAALRDDKDRGGDDQVSCGGLLRTCVCICVLLTRLCCAYTTRLFSLPVCIAGSVERVLFGTGRGRLPEDGPFGGAFQCEIVPAERLGR